jgi:hypothetical protein
MVFLINVLFALVAGAITNALMREASVNDSVRVIVVLLVGIVFFMLNLAANVI